MNFFEAKKKGKIVLFAVMLFGVVTRLVSNDNTMLTVSLFVCAFKNVDFDNLLKISIYTKITLLVVLALLYFNGFTDRGAIIQGGIIRHSMGFGNPNTFSTHVLSIIIQTFYLHRNKFKTTDLFVFLVGVISIYGLAHSKTQIICATIALGMFVVKTIVNTKGRFLKALTKWSLRWAFVIGAVLSLGAIFKYMVEPELMEPLNAISSKRISSAATVINQNDGISFFGKPVDRTVKRDYGNGWAELSTRVFDNGYAYIALYYGFISLCLFAVIFYRYNNRSIKKDSGQTAWMLMVYAISGVAEHFFIEIAMNIFLLKYSELIYEDHKETEPSC